MIKYIFLKYTLGAVILNIVIRATFFIAITKPRLNDCKLDFMTFVYLAKKINQIKI